MTTPHLDTIKRMDTFCEGTLELFCSPLWEALFSVETNSDNSFDVFNKLDLDVQMCVIASKNNAEGKYVVKNIKQSDIYQIRRIGSLSALACLILLRQQNAVPSSSESRKKLNEHIVECALNMYVSRGLPSVFLDLLQILKLPFCWTVKNNKYIERNDLSLQKEIESRNQRLHSLKSLSHCRRLTMPNLALSLIDIGNKNLDSEIFSAMQQEDPRVSLSSPTNRMLYWLLKELNKALDRGREFGVYKKECRYFLYKGTLTFDI
tara:strand:+ start:1290 stop:2078 length:789 start_codon:yes stop_codon:yes gene_type:complete